MTTHETETPPETRTPLQQVRDLLWKNGGKRITISDNCESRFELWIVGSRTLILNFFTNGNIELESVCAYLPASPGIKLSDELRAIRNYLDID